jgi:hypothetical protein
MHAAAAYAPKSSRHAAAAPVKSPASAAYRGLAVSDVATATATSANSSASGNGFALSG